jgi:hypothetical protein
MDAKYDQVERPAHYTYSAIEPIDVIEAWQLGFHLGNVLKYVARAGRKGVSIIDLKKARWYLDREIARMDEEATEEEEQPESSVCPQCSGTGVSRFSNRPDDYGPHTICYTCRGTGICRRDD